MKKRVLLTTRFPDSATRLLSRYFSVDVSKTQLNEEQLIRRVKPYHALLCTLSDPITEKVIFAAPKLQCVANYAVGYNNINLVAAKKMRIWVTNTPNVLTEATADIVWALILSCARRVPEGEKLMRTDSFKGWNPLLLRGIDLSGKILGIFGFGRIGQAVARRGRGWNMKTLYHQRHRENRGVERKFGAEFVSFETLLRNSDILSVNAPLTPQTRHRFARREFQKMKPTAIFVNAARGAIHHERELMRALRKKTLFSAGLDVYEFEPEVSPELLRLPNCTLLPHLGSATFETRDKMALLAAQNIQLVLVGAKPKTPVFQINFKDGGKELK